MTEKIIQLRPSSYSEKLGNYIKQLEEENEKLKEDLEAEKSTNSNLARRILKAIEYMGRRDLEWGSEEHEKMMKILKGEENE